MAGRQVVYDRAGADSTIAGFLKEDYVRDKIRSLVNTSTYFLSQLEKRKKETTHGKKFILPVKLATSQGGGARGENVVLPSPGFGEYDQLSGNVKYMYYPFYITGPSIEATKGSKAAFADALTRAVEDTKEIAKLDMQRQSWGDGTGVLFRIDGAHVAQTTLAIDDPYGLAYVAGLTNTEKTITAKRGMLINIYTPGGAGTNLNREIVSVDRAGGTIEVDAATTCADNDVVYRGEATGNTANSEITGINGFLQTTGTYLGLARAGFPELQANIVTFGGDMIDLEDDMQATDDTIFVNGTDPYTLILTTVAIRREYVRQLQSQRRQVNPMKLEGGFDAIEFNGKGLMVDKDAPPQRMYFLRMEDIHWRYMGEDGWMNEDGNMLNRVSNGGTRDAYEAFWKSYKDMVTEAPANHAVLEDIV
jgi:hypothetical protein